MKEKKLTRKNTKKATNKMIVVCENCAKSGVVTKKCIKATDIQIRQRGYRGLFQAYVPCEKCGKNILIRDEVIPENIYRYLTKKWLSMLDE